MGPLGASSRKSTSSSSDCGASLIGAGVVAGASPAESSSSPSFFVGAADSSFSASTAAVSLSASAALRPCVGRPRRLSSSLSSATFIPSTFIVWTLNPRVSLVWRARNPWMTRIILALPNARFLFLISNLTDSHMRLATNTISRQTLRLLHRMRHGVEPNLSVSQKFVASSNTESASSLQGRTRARACSVKTDESDGRAQQANVKARGTPRIPRIRRYSTRGTHIAVLLVRAAIAPFNRHRTFAADPPTLIVTPGEQHRSERQIEPRE